MHSFPLIRSQLVPPSIKSLLRRERLLDAGLSILSFRVTTVIAPAGYGKSVWIASLTEEKDWPATAWLSLDENDREPTCLLYHLIHAVQTVLPEFGSESLRTINSLGNINHDWPIAAAVFLEELPEEDLVLVLDDFYFVQESITNLGIIEYFLRWLPANKHLIIISRYHLPLNLSRYRMHSDLLEINSDQLLFTSEESRNFFALLSLDLDEENLAALQQATEGWAVCLHLAGTVIKQAEIRGGKFFSAMKYRDSALYQYLGHELLAFLPKKLTRFLIDSSLLSYLEEKLCNASFKCRDSRLKIETLHSAGLLSRVEGEIVTWRMHHLIKEYLSEEIKKTSSPEHIAAIRRRACSFLEKRGEIDQAIEQAVESADWARAAELICRYGYEYYTQTGRLEALYAWVERLPGDLVEDDPWLLFFKGRSILQIENEEALALLTASAEKASQKGDLRCEANCLLAMSYAQVQNGDMKVGGVIIQRLLANPLLMKDPASHGAALSVALGNAISRDDIQQGLKFSRRALRLRLNAELRMTVLYGSAVMQHRAGNLSQALYLLNEAINMPFVQENERWLVSGYLVLTTVLNLMGNSLALQELCQKALVITHKYNMLADIGRLHRNLARMHFREGRFSEARREYEEAYINFIDSNSISYAIHSSIELALVRLRTGENARELLVETRNLIKELETNPVGQGGDQIAASVLGILAIEANDLDEARQLFENLVESHRQNGAKQNLPGTSMLLAYVYWLQGKEKACDNLLRKALALAEARQLISFWEWHEPVIYSMCRRAEQKNIHANWALRILSRWFPQRIRHELGQLLISSQENLHSFAQSQLHDLFQETGKAVVHLFYFNRFQVFVNGCEVPQTDWKTQKAENLLKLLAADRRRHAKEIIVEQLWPGSKSGDANLRMALSQVRKVLGYYGAINESIVVHRKTIYLNPDIEWYTDFDLFSSEAHQAFHYSDIAHPQELSCLEQAVHIYNGPFLPEDIYDTWTNNKRIHLQGLYLQVLKRLAEFYASRNDRAKAVTTCNRYLEVEPTDEIITRMSMRLLASLGQRQKALSAYSELVKTLNCEYNITPENETRDLYERICAAKI